MSDLACAIIIATIIWTFGYVMVNDPLNTYHCVDNKMVRIEETNDPRQ